MNKDSGGTGTSTRLDDIFSEGNLLGYADACLGLAVNLPESHHRTRFDTLVIPSRGAVPFFLGMAYALPKLADMSQEHKKFYETLGVQEMLAPIIPKVAEPLVGRLGNNNVRVMLAPFTADVNMREFNASLNTDDFVPRIREYWARVTAAFMSSRSFFGTSARSRDPYFKSFVDGVLRDIEGRDSIAESYERFPSIDRFAMIDTVISGRASNDILKAFDRLAAERDDPRLKPFTFLVADENGRKLRPEALRYLRRKQLEGQVHLYEVPHIVSEDRGARLLGVASVVYPSIMQGSRALTLDGQPFFVGAGSWRLVTDLDRGSNYADTFGAFMDTVYRAIDTRFANGYLDTETEAMAREDLERSRKLFLSKANERRVLNNIPETPETLGLKHPVQRYFETHSGVGHVVFSESVTNHVLKKFAGFKGVRINK